MVFSATSARGAYNDLPPPEDAPLTKHHEPGPGSASVAHSTALTHHVTALSVSCAVVLIVLKLIAWWFSGSIAVLASLVDSGLDVVAALGTFIAVRYAAAPPDSDHRFGHGKAEAFASLVQSGLVLASAVLIGWEAVQHIIKPLPLSNEGGALVVMVVSLILSTALVMAQTRVLRRTASVAVSGDRAHYVADVASNIAALLGIGAAALLHEAWIDALAGLVVAGWLLWGAVGVFSSSSYQLLDQELSAAARERIRVLAADDPNILHIHELRTRASGPYVHIQMHAELPPTMTLDRAHQIIVAAERRVLKEFPAADILIHADPYGSAEPHGGAFPESYDGTEAPEESTG